MSNVYYPESIFKCNIFPQSHCLQVLRKHSQCWSQSLKNTSVFQAHYFWHMEEVTGAVAGTPQYLPLTQADQW